MRHVSTVEDDAEPLSGRAYAHIVEMIVNGSLVPGEVANEVELARTLGMSRGPVREAMRRLEGRRLLVREPYQKARVISFGPKEVRELFEFREGMETVACRLATERMGTASVSALRDRLEKSRGTDDKVDIHFEIARNCGNERIREFLCGDIYDLLRIYRKWSGQAGRSPDAFDEHWQILKAMESSDATLAESLMRSHIRRATDHVVSLI